jgi:hypothetical protein
VLFLVDNEEEVNKRGWAWCGGVVVRVGFSIRERGLQRDREATKERGEAESLPKEQTKK